MLILFFISLEKLLCHLNYILSDSRKDNPEFGLVHSNILFIHISDLNE